MSIHVIGPADSYHVTRWGTYAHTLTPAGLCTDIPALLDKVPSDSDALVVIPADPTIGQGREAVVKAIIAAGWRTQPTEGAFFSCIPDDHHPHANRVVLTVAEWWDPGDPFLSLDGAPFNAAVGKIAYRFHDWRLHTGVHYVHNAGASTITAIRQAIPQSVIPRFTAPEPGGRSGWWQPPVQITDLKMPGPRTGHHWDMRSAYLAAAAAVSLPGKLLTQTGPDVGLGSVGYFRIRPVGSDRHLMAKIGITFDRHGCAWVCHPTLEWLSEINVTPDVVDSWTAPVSSRLLRPWAEMWRDTMAAPPMTETLQKAMKRGYAHALGGLLGVEGGTLYRPDWRHMIIDQVRASMLRRIGSVARLCDGLMPNTVDVDSVWYDTDDPGHVGAALGEGPNIGRMRYQP